jgi:hypothetical protein
MANAGPGRVVAEGNPPNAPWRPHGLTRLTKDGRQHRCGGVDDVQEP